MSDPVAIKLVVSPPTDTDPPTNAIYTADNVIGINPPFSMLKDLTTPYDFGAVGDGDTDDTEALQDWLNQIAGNLGYGAPGVFLVSATLSIASGTTILGAGAGTFIIKKSEGYPAASPVLVNNTFSTVAGTYTNSNIKITGVCFDGSNIVSTNSDLSFLGVQGLLIQDCKFQYNYFGCIACTNTQFANIEHCEFYAWGILGGPGSIWFGDDNVDTTISRCWFHNGGSGITMFSTRCRIVNNTMTQLLETGIFGYPHYCLIDGNNISGIRFDSVTALGIEIAGYAVMVSNNIISDTDGPSIAFENVVEGAIVNNTFELAGVGADVHPIFTDCPVVWLLSFDQQTLSFNGAHVTNPFMGKVIVANNNISNTHGKCVRAISCFNVGGLPMVNIDIHGNNISDTYSGDVIFTFDGIRGTNFRTLNNFPSDDCAPVVVLIELTSGLTEKHVIVGFEPRWIQFSAAFGSATEGMGSIGQVSAYTAGDDPTPTLSHDVNTCISWAASAIAGRTTIPQDLCINVVNAAGTQICAAAVSSKDSTSFTLTISVCTTTTFVLATCYR